MTKYTKKLLNATTVIGMFLSAPVLAANSFQDVIEANSASIRADEIVEAPANREPSLAANSFQEVVNANSASTRTQEIVEAPANRPPVLAANSFLEVVEANSASIRTQEMIGDNEAIAVDDRKVDTTL